MVRMGTNVRIMNKIVYPELSYKIMGTLFDVHNKIGSGHKEKYIQNAVEIVFKRKLIKYKKELISFLKYSGKNIGKYY